MISHTQHMATFSPSRELSAWCAASLRERAEPARALFAAEAPALARVARAMAERFERGGRILACGRGAYATDAMHVAVEFTQPVLVGKRALPALDISLDCVTLMRALVRENDIAIGFGPARGDCAVDVALAAAHAAGAMTIKLPGHRGADTADRVQHYALEANAGGEHRLQELVEVIGHVLYESVHVFLEHRSGSHDVGASSFLYPFLTAGERDLEGVTAEVASSIIAKVQDGERLRERIAAQESDSIARAIEALGAVVERGGTLLCFGNGGSATDAIDFALDCAGTDGGFTPVRAISLAHEPATITAILNDVGRDVIFVRQIIAQSQPGDAVVAFSTSGGSTNVIAALEEARKRGLVSVALLGYDGGEIARRNLADHTIVVRSDFVPRVQEAQAAVYHTLRSGLERLAAS
ncbi:MAG: hypothetical protein NVS3B28_22940 [Candidatus Velthaea sp.]